MLSLPEGYLDLIYEHHAQIFRRLQLEVCFLNSMACARQVMQRAADWELSEGGETVGETESEAVRDKVRDTAHSVLTQ